MDKLKNIFKSSAKNKNAEASSEKLAAEEKVASAEELFAHPMHPYTKSLLSAIPLPDPVYERNRRRIVYNPLAEHDYSVDKPAMREVVKGHFIYCNDKEEVEYKRILEGEEQ